MAKSKIQKNLYNTAIIGAGGNREHKCTTKNKKAETNFKLTSIVEFNQKRRETYIDSFPEFFKAEKSRKSGEEYIYQVKNVK